MRRPLALLASALLLAGASLVGAVGVKLRPQDPAIEKIVLDILKRLSTPAVPLTLDKTGGPLLALGGAVPFNPDLSSRTVNVKGEKRIEFNPAGPQPLQAEVETELLLELGLKVLTPEAARLRFSGVDLNGDGKVDTADLALLMSSFGKAGSNLRGDLNGDGRIDDLDLRLFSAAYRLP